MTPAPHGGERPGDACVFVVYGVAGDLTRRKLLPALYNLRCYGLLPRNFAMIGVARRDYSHEKFRDEMARAIREFATRSVDEGVWAEFERRLYFCPGEFHDASTYARLREMLAEVQAAHQTGGNVLFYLATPPESFREVVEHSGADGLLREPPGAWRRVIVEKPFGRDLASARELNAHLLAHLAESQIYRIDHYLGKETVQNILAFRFANGLFEPIWNRRYVDHVQIMVAETVGVETRGGFYETAGVLRDMIQNHMFQLLALVAMEPPISFDPDEVRNEKVRVLRAIHPLEGGSRDADVARLTVRGQYGEGAVNGKRVPAYRNEPKVSPQSKTETYAALKLEIENWRWAGVPFYLRSGKRLARRDTEIMMEFRQPPQMLFRGTGCGAIEPNRLVLHIQPEEGISLSMKAKHPGPGLHLESVNLDFSYKDFGETTPATGYERLLYDAMVGDSTLFHRTDMVDAAWRIATPILEAWAAQPPPDFPNYAAGTWGPAAADDLLARDGRAWWNHSASPK